MALKSATFDTTLPGALALGPQALARAVAAGSPYLVSAVVEDDALVLGALQRAETVSELSPESRAPITLRRATTGTEARLRGRALYHALALPRVDAVYADARARTLLNRNLRVLLRGYASLGLPLRYFGTEVLSLVGHPVALVGYDQLEGGAVLIEVLIGLDQPVVIRPALRRSEPRGLSTWENAPQRAPPHLLEVLAKACAERSALALEAVNDEFVLESAGIEEAPALAPAPQAMAWARRAVPIGVLEAGVSALAPPRVQLAGDVLASRHAFALVERAVEARLADAGSPDARVLSALQSAPLDGARSDDVLEVLRASCSARSMAPRTP